MSSLKSRSSRLRGDSVSVAMVLIYAAAVSHQVCVETELANTMCSFSSQFSSSRVIALGHILSPSGI